MTKSTLGNSAWTLNPNVPFNSWSNGDMAALEELPAKIMGDLNIPHLDRLFDQTKAKVFLGKNASFFGSQ